VLVIGRQCEAKKGVVKRGFPGNRQNSRRKRKREINQRRDLLVPGEPGTGRREQRKGGEGPAASNRVSSVTSRFVDATTKDKTQRGLVTGGVPGGVSVAFEEKKDLK